MLAVGISKTPDQTSAIVLWERGLSQLLHCTATGPAHHLMTSIFDRYIFRQAAGTMILILLSLSGVVWIALALKQLNVVTSEGQSTATFLLLTTLALPNLMALIAPIALLVALIHILTRLNGDSELIVLTASGATMWTVTRPLLVLGLLVSLAVSGINHVVMPWSLRELSRTLAQVRTDLLGQVIQPGLFSSPEANLTFHIRDRALNGELIGLLLHDTRNTAEAVTIIAEKGVVQKQDASSFLFMTKGHIIRSTNPKEAPQIIAFETYAIDLDRFERPTSAPALRPRERYFNELAYPAPDDPEFKRQPGFFRAELHERLASPLYPLAFVLIALACVGQAQSTRQKRWQGVATAVLSGFGLRVAGLGINNLVVVHAKWVPLLYGWPIGAMVLSLCFILLNSRPKRGPRPTERLRFAIEDAWLRLRPRKVAVSSQSAASAARPRLRSTP